MIPLGPLTSQAPLRILCLGAHSDDIEIGCGATLSNLCSTRSDIEVTWVVFSAEGVRGSEAQESAERFLSGASGTRIQLFGFRDGFFPFQGAEIKERFEELKKAISPDLIFTHRGGDRHQDHRLISDLTWNTFRSHLVLEYEIPKYDGDLGQPNVFCEIPEEARRRKIELLMECFGSQRSKRWFSPETFDGLMRLRGVECAADSGWAEGFYARKLIVRF